MQITPSPNFSETLIAFLHSKYSNHSTRQSVKKKNHREHRPNTSNCLHPRAEKFENFTFHPHILLHRITVVIYDLRFIPDDKLRSKYCDNSQNLLTTITNPTIYNSLFSLRVILWNGHSIPTKVKTPRMHRVWPTGRKSQKSKALVQDKWLVALRWFPIHC